MYKLFPKFWSDDEVKDLRKYFLALESTKAASISRTNPEDSYDTSRIAQMFTERAENIPDHFKNKLRVALHDAIPIDDEYYFMEPWSVNVYHGHEKGKFDWHVDRLDYFIKTSSHGNESPDETFMRNTRPQREISVSVALNNKSDYNKGWFVIDKGDNKPSKVELNAGDMIIFDSDTFHGVEPITEGRREALIIWAVHKSKVMQWSELCEVPTLDPDPA
jgi:hypothetical protein|tara:strand:- start:780 stop:1436 length:657 start_codon:yes stop_codon:yes gene_type:complete